MSIVVDPPESIVQDPPAGGDMFKSEYDPDADGIIEGAQVDDASKLKGETSGLREEHGSVSVNVGPAGDSTTNSQAVAYVTVSFATAFAATPKVYHSLQSFYIGVYSSSYGATTTSFKQYLQNLSTYDPGPLPVAWLAIGS